MSEPQILRDRVKLRGDLQRDAKTEDMSKIMVAAFILFHSDAFRQVHTIQSRVIRVFQLTNRTL
jgi:hypothetical protein